MSHALPFLRIKGRETSEVILACSPVNLPTHFLSRRMLCSGSTCPACSYDEPRVFSYAIARSLGSGKLVLLEVPASTLGAVQRSLLLSCDRLSSGSHLRLSRKHSKAPVFGDWIGQVDPIELTSGITLARAVLAAFGVGSCSEVSSLVDAVHYHAVKIKFRLDKELRELGYGDRELIA